MYTLTPLLQAAFDAGVKVGLRVCGCHCYLLILSRAVREETRG
jgi:hypothetical protein